MGTSTGQDRRRHQERAHRDTANSLLIIAQLPLTHHLNPAVRTLSGCVAAHAGDYSMNSPHCSWYGMVAVMDEGCGSWDSSVRYLVDIGLCAHKTCLSLARTVST